MIQDIVSYNIKQSRNDPHNLVSVLMHEKKITAQSAVDKASEMIEQAIRLFTELENTIPPWNEEVDRDVKFYVRGLRDWIIGSVHWAYETEMYFQGNGEEVRMLGWIFLLPNEEDEDNVIE